MKTQLKQMLGNLAVCAFPKMAKSIEEGSVTPRGLLGKLITDSLIRKAAVEGDEAELRKRLSQYWKGDSGDAFYEAFADRFQGSFLGEHYQLVEALEQEIGATDTAFEELYEIGCGDGQVLSHLAEKFPDVSKLVGIDINENIINKNRESRGTDRISFECGDAAALIEEHATSGMVMFSYGGVMEYFLESELAKMFAILKQKSPVLIALVEPLYDGFDPEKETTSKSSGMEHSFSHNHRHLLEQAGFEIKYQKLLEAEFRWMMIVAKG